MMRPVKKWLTALTVLCLSALAGCGNAEITRVPVVVPLIPCAEPLRPETPPVDHVLYFDELPNAEALMAKDDITREYIESLWRTIRCYEKQGGNAQ